MQAYESELKILLNRLKVNENYNILKKQELQRRIVQLEELIADCNHPSLSCNNSENGDSHHEVQQRLGHEYYNNINSYHQQYSENHMKADNSQVRSSSKCSTKPYSATSRNTELSSVVGSTGNLPPFSWLVHSGGIF